jgi:polar amino acid transport system substrate-binding protein
MINRHAVCLGLLVFLSPLQSFAQSCSPKIDNSHLIEPGKLQVSVNPTIPPQQYIDEKGELQGLNVDLGRAIAAKLCLEAVFIRMDFPAMVPALQAKRFDAIFTGMFWTEERSKIAYLVPMALSAISIYTLPDSKLQITKFEDLAGRVVGVEAATYQERKSKELNEALVAKGLKPVDFRSFATATATYAALKAGQLEAGINLNETAADLVKRGLAKVWVDGLAATEITFAFRDKQLAEASAKALTELKADGTYDRIFDKFKMTPVSGATFAIHGTGPM